MRFKKGGGLGLVKGGGNLGWKKCPLQEDKIGPANSCNGYQGNGVRHYKEVNIKKKKHYPSGRFGRTDR